MILILTGPTRTHKTTTLRNWIKGRSDVAGVLSPDEGNLRVLLHVKDGQTIPWQRSAPQPGDLVIGRFSFDPNGFVTATGWLNEGLKDPAVRYIILDEIGNLELQGKGWDTWMRTALPLPEEKTLILVVRRPLLDEVIQRYQLDEISIVDRRYFEKELGE